jgi:imidazolonepropionase-like amidohydrolase
MAAWRSVTTDVTNDGTSSWLVRGLRIFDASGELSPIVDIAVADGVICDVGQALQPAPGAEILDATGLVAVPSLVDIHVHSARESDIAAYAKAGIRHIRFAGLDLATVRTARARATVGSAWPLAISSCGPMLDSVRPAYPAWTTVVESPVEAADAARSLIASGEVDALIVTQGVTGSFISAIVNEAHSAGLPVVGQVWAADGIEASRAGIDQLDNSSRVFASRTVSSAEMLAYGSVGERLATWARAWADVDWPRTERIMDAMVDNGVSYCPTLVAHEFHAGYGEDIVRRDSRWESWFDESDLLAYKAFLAYIEDDWAEQTRVDMARSIESRLEWIRRFRAGGGKIVVGTDMPFGGLTMVRELELLMESGMTGSEAIYAATQGAADALGKAGFVARIELGAEASFILTDSDPGLDITTLRRPQGVFLKGRKTY